MLCGANWNNGSNSGVFAMNLNNYRTNSNNNVGSRDSISLPEITKVNTGDTGIQCPAKSEINNVYLFSSNSENQIHISKRFGNLYDKVFTIDNLYEAYLIARKGKRKKNATLKFEINLGSELNSLYNELKNRTYIPQQYREFIIYEPK